MIIFACGLALLVVWLIYGRNWSDDSRRKDDTATTPRTSNKQPRVVQFRDGTYGIRRQWCDSWEFLSTSLTLDGEKTYWWLRAHDDCHYATQAAAEAAMLRDAELPLKVFEDIGVKVTSSND